jgi:hypothetical protein
VGASLTRGSRVSRVVDGVHLAGVIAERPNAEGYTYVRWVCSQVGEELRSYTERVHIEEIKLIAEDAQCPLLDELRRKVLR